MRVISGKYKGRVLLGDNIKGTRPTQARVKESLFSTIQNEVVDSVILDLFAGSGALGIEAISMNAKFLYFVEHQNKTYNVLCKNLQTLGIKNAKTYKMDYISFLKNCSIKFDLVFLDPPYDSDFINKSINLLIKKDLLKHDSLVVCETDDLKRIEERDEFLLVKSKKYSDKYIVILKKV